ncbi:MAG: 23S rRNA (adenine(2503)-C(2))-methyltransferase RlmN [Anaerolineales bacterium]
MESSRKLIYDLSKTELESWLKSIGESQFRANQIWVALYQNLKETAGEISTLPKALREKLTQSFIFQALKPLRSIKSADGNTIKTLFELVDGEKIEVVLMYYDERRTLCISSQVGCGVGCSFCATGQMGLRRNLTVGEIVAQVLYYAHDLIQDDEKVTNLVVMGMGEPFHNYENLMAAMDRLNASEAFGLGARRITISTVGIIPKIYEFADAGSQYNLAISLHTVDDALRSTMIPINRKYPVDPLMKACRYYIDQTRRRITFEYALIQDVNDTIEDAEALASKIRGMNCHVNLIPLNPIQGYPEKGSNVGQVHAFLQVLDDHHIQCSVRLRRGIEIKAGCGQLAIRATTSQ